MGKKRSTGITIFAYSSTILGVISVILSISQLTIGIFNALYLLLAGMIFLAIGKGMLDLKEWSRRIVIVLCVLAFFNGLIPINKFSGTSLNLIIFYFIRFSILGMIVFYFTRLKVKEQFACKEKNYVRKKSPKAIFILSIILIICVAVYFFTPHFRGGLVKLYYDDGSLKQESIYKDGKKELVHIYDEQGYLVETEYYKDNMLAKSRKYSVGINGPYFDEIKNGFLVVERREYDAKGQLTSRITYEYKDFRGDNGIERKFNKDSNLIFEKKF